MENFKGICSTKSTFTGTQIQKDFDYFGFHQLNFSANGKFIGVSIGGYNSNFLFYFVPNNGKQAKLNKYFIERYILACDNSSEILLFFNINP